MGLKKSKRVGLCANEQWEQRGGWRADRLSRPSSGGEASSELPTEAGESRCAGVETLVPPNDTPRCRRFGRSGSVSPSGESRTVSGEGPGDESADGEPAAGDCGGRRASSSELSFSRSSGSGSGSGCLLFWSPEVEKARGVRSSPEERRVKGSGSGEGSLP